MSTTEDHEPWPLRAALLLALGASLGLLLHWLTGSPDGLLPNDTLRATAACLVAVAGLTFAFTLERRRWLWSAAFAFGSGLIVAGIFYWNGGASEWNADEGWHLAASLLAIAIAAPLFQTLRDGDGRSLEARPVHDHGWGNLVLWFAAWGFVVITWLLAHLLAELFQLIGIGLLSDALQQGWFTWMLLSGALGGAVGLLRDRDEMLGQIQRVATAVLSVLAPVLALGLLLFVAALPFTGLTSLWDQTRATTPIILSCIIGSVVLVAAAIGSTPSEEARRRPVRWAAAALCGIMLPLAAVAALSTWMRVAQYGYTPERLWALVAVAVALAFGLAYAAALLRGRRDWPRRVRQANVALALGLVALALLLATPLINFGAISTRAQLARLQSGAVKPADFDWAALAFQFGPEGRAALARLRQTGSPEIRQAARDALASENRWEAAEAVRVRGQARRLAANVRILPAPAPLPESLALALGGQSVCAAGPCTLFWSPGSAEAVAVGFGCATCAAEVVRLSQTREGTWESVDPHQGRDPDAMTAQAGKSQRQAAAAGRVELRSVTRRQVYVDGKPVGSAFE
jgi:hypothetical protein